MRQLQTPAGKMSSAVGQAELHTFSLIKNLHRVVRSSASFDHGICCVEHVPSAIALHESKLAAEAWTLFVRKCRVNQDHIVRTRLNTGDRLMRVMRENLRDLLEVGLRHARMRGGQTTPIHGLAVHACRQRKSDNKYSEKAHGPNEN